MKIQLESSILFILFGVCGSVAILGGIFEIYCQLTTLGKLKVTNSLGHNVTGSPFSGAKVDANFGKGKGMLAGGILALLSGFLMFIGLIVTWAAWLTRVG